MARNAARGAERATFRPRVTLALLYFAAFFLLFCLVFALPVWIEIARSTAPGPQQEELVFQATRNALRPKIHAAAALALVVTALGIYMRRLPGLRG